MRSTRSETFIPLAKKKESNLTITPLTVFEKCVLYIQFKLSKKTDTCVAMTE